MGLGRSIRHTGKLVKFRGFSLRSECPNFEVYLKSPQEETYVFKITKLPIKLIKITKLSLNFSI